MRQIRTCVVMKATPSPATSPPEILPAMVRPGRCSPREHFVPRSASALGNAFGFAAASQRLAQRRSVVSRKVSPTSDAMQFNLASFLPPGRTPSDYLWGDRSQGLSVAADPMLQYRPLAEADLERSQLTAHDQFEVHDLDKLLLGGLVQQLRRYPICRADLVKKTLRFFPEQPLYVLLVTPIASQDDAIPGAADSTLGTQIAQELRFSRELLVCLTDQMEPALSRRIQGQSGGSLLELA